MNVAIERHELEQIVQSVAPRGQLLRAWSLPGGMSAQMDALEIMLPDGRTQKLVVRRYNENHLRRNPNAAATEFRLLHLTHSAGLPTPQPYYLDAAGQYLIMEFMAGKMLFAPANVNQHVTQLATQLAQIHRLNKTNSDISFLGESVTLCTELGRQPLTDIDPSLNEAQICSALASRPLAPSQTRPLTLLHGDFWPGNSLWQDGELVAVIDWEDAMWGIHSLIWLAAARKLPGFLV